MHSAMIAVFLVLGLSFQQAHADETKKSKLNTQLYEQDAGNSVSGKVKVIREVQDETEVFIDSSKGSQGPYTLSSSAKDRGTLMSRLQKSAKPGGPSVTLQFDDQQRILSVEVSEQKAPAKSSNFDQWHM